MTKAPLSPKIFADHPDIRSAFSLKGEANDLQGFGINLSFKVGDDRGRVEKARREFFSVVGLTSDDVAIPDQIHSTNVRSVLSGGMIERCDALVTSKKGLGLVVTVADCVPILLYDRKNDAVGAVHAGWRGSAGEIVRKTLKVMEQDFGTKSADIVAWIGPAAGSCCYQVGEEVASQFREGLRHERNGMWYLDLKNENRAQLVASGVDEVSIECSTLCTICTPFLHSYRREGDRSGRMMAIISLNR